MIKQGTITGDVADGVIVWTVQGKDEVEASIDVAGTWSTATVTIKLHQPDGTWRAVTGAAYTANFGDAWRLGPNATYCLTVTGGGTPSLTYSLS